MARKADLITGLLGAGKTTLLAELVRQLRLRGQHPAVIVNDHGAVSVDAMLLREELGEDTPVELVIDDGDPGCHKRRVRAKLIALAMEGADRVILEPSGVFEPQEFFDLLREDPLERWYEPGNVIAVVEAVPREWTREDRFLLVSQLADAGAVVLSKAAGTTPDQRRAVLEAANAALEEFRCDRRLGAEVLQEPWETWTPAQWDRLLTCGVAYHDAVRLAGEDRTETVYFLEAGLRAEELAALREKLFSGAYGRVRRVKGFLPGAGGWMRFNATATELELRETTTRQECFIVIGEGLDRPGLEAALRKNLQ